MRTIYDYLFLKLYQLMKKTPGKRTADNGALCFLVTALFFYTIPFLGFLIDNLTGKVEKWIFMVIALSYAYLLFKINERYFIQNGELARVVDKHKNESNTKSVLGFIAAIAFVLFSFVAFFLFLSFF